MSRLFPLRASRDRPAGRRPTRPEQRALLIVALATALILIVLVSERAGASNPGPWFSVGIDSDTVIGGGWAANTALTIKLSDQVTPPYPTYTFTDTTNSNGWFELDLTGKFDIRPTLFATVGGGGSGKSLGVSFVTATASDEAADTVTGNSQPGADVLVWVEGMIGQSVATVADASGHWTVDFTGVRDLKAGTVLGVREYDIDGDGTQIEVVLPVQYDGDGDGILDPVDNCPKVANATQYDGDGDGIGARCDAVDRVWGADRYWTSASVSSMAFESAGTVFLALGTKFPDALVAAAAGGYEHGPVLLTGKDMLPPGTIIELNRLSPCTVYIVGGTAVVSSTVEEQVAALGLTVERLAGANRYETAKAVSAKIFPTATAVIVAFGENFPDALVGAAAAGHHGYPVLLTGRDHVPQATIDELERLSPGLIYVIGGTAVISETVATELGKHGTVARYAGPDRYATAAAVAAKFFPTAKQAFLASGRNFPDALVAAAAGGFLDAPVLLVTHDAVPQATRDRLDATTPHHIWIAGGEAVIGGDVFNALP